MDDKMKFTCFSVLSRLPGGEKFRDLAKTLTVVLHKPSKITWRAFRLSLHHFLCGGKYGILIPDINSPIPEKLYHVSSVENREKILSEGITSADSVIFASNCTNEILGYINWKYGFDVDFESLEIFTINTQLCSKSGYDFCKLARGNEFIAEKALPNTIIAHANLAQFSFPNHCDN